MKHVCPLRFKEFTEESQQECIGERCMWHDVDRCAARTLPLLVDCLHQLLIELRRTCR